MKYRTLLALLLLAQPLNAQGDEAALTRGRTLTNWLYRAKVDSLLPVLSPEFLQVAGGRQGFINLTQAMPSQLGVEMQVLSEAAYQQGGLVSYHRVATFSSVPHITVTVEWTWRAADGIVAGARISPTPTPAPTEHAAYETKSSLMLPFDGEWYVAWGGDTPHQNYHVTAPDQRFANDFFIMRNGRSFAGDSTRNESYFCYGQPIRAPAAGRIVARVDSIADNVPGVMNAAMPPGNHVVIDHGNGEYSLLAHFRRGSVLVREGQQVSQGEQLAECGNSGNSSEPHLHYHLQTGAAFGSGAGLPAFFTDYRSGSRVVQRGRPLRGETIRRNVNR